MRIVLTGGTGTVGRRFAASRLARGDEVAVVTRRPLRARSLLPPDVELVAGDPTVPGAWQEAIDGADAVVHLAGAGVADRRWNEEYRDEIEASRVEGTHQVVQAIAEARRPPRVFVSASAVGFYGDRGDETLDETVRAGRGFLSEVCLRWEREAMKAASLPHPPRVALARIGIVLDAAGGFLARVLPHFRRGLGARIGPGARWVPWIHHADCVAALSFLLEGDLAGPVNLVAPRPATAFELTAALAAATGRPAFLPVPYPVLRLAVGGVAADLVASRRAVPARLLERGFVFTHPTVAGAVATAVREATAGTVAAPARARAQLPATVPSEPPRLVLVNAADLAAPDARAALLAASAGGAQVALVSSSRGPELDRLVPESLRPLVAPIAIAANGAVLWSLRERRSLRSERIDPPTLAAIVAAIRRLAPQAWLLFEGEDWLAGEREPVGIAERLDLRLAPGESPPLPTVRLHVFGTRESVALAGRAVETPFWRERRVTLFARDGSIEVAAPLVDRAVALQRLARTLGTPRERIAAILSEEDDLGLAEWCGRSLASAAAGSRVGRLATETLAADLDPARGLRPAFARLGFS